MWALSPNYLEPNSLRDLRASHRLCPLVVRKLIYDSLGWRCMRTVIYFLWRLTAVCYGLQFGDLFRAVWVEELKSCGIRKEYRLKLMQLNMRNESRVAYIICERLFQLCNA